MKQLFHADRIGEHRAKTAEGYLLALDVPVARTGWQQYKASELQLENVPGDTLVSVYRDAAEVFDPTAVASFEGKTITKLHPPEFLNPENDRQYAIGHMQNVREGDRLPDGERALIANLLVKDSQAIQYIQTGVMSDLSCGYTYNLELMADEHDPQMKLRMTNIRGNHLALVPTGRAGNHVRVLDAALPEEGSNMDLKELFAAVKDAGLRLVPYKAQDAESETVKTQEEKMEEAKQLRARTEDAEKEESAKEEAKKAADAALTKRLDAQDALLKKLVDGVEELAKKKEEPKEGEDAKCTCDAAEGEPHKEDCPMYKKEAEDADLIPVATLPKEDRPKNPIPGADAALANLLAIKPIVAASRNRQAIDQFNLAVNMLKGRTGAKGEDAFKILNEAIAKDRDGVRNQPQVMDSAAVGASFEEECKKHHRKTVTVQ